jgi:hypothetical protein
LEQYLRAAEPLDPDGDLEVFCCERPNFVRVCSWFNSFVFVHECWVYLLHREASYDYVLQN